jgi:hypothetical protein
MVEMTKHIRFHQQILHSKWKPLMPVIIMQSIIHSHDVPLPSNPVMITFDDTREQFSVAAGWKYGFKACFFIMTISINRPGYEQKSKSKLVLTGMVGAYLGSSYGLKILYKRLEYLVWTKGKTGRYHRKPVTDFAYPFGWIRLQFHKIKKVMDLWNETYLVYKEIPVDPLYH